MDDEPDGVGTARRSVARDRRAAAEAAAEVPGIRPVLRDAQLAVLRRYGSESWVPAGQVLFAEGDATYDLIVVLAGAVDVVEHHRGPGEYVIASFGAMEFIGEMGILTGQRAYLSAVATSDSQVLRVPLAELQVIMAEELELSELLLRAFLLRHSFLTSQESGLTLVGSRFHVDTRRLLEVLARNRLPSRWLELESSPEAESVLRELKVPIGDLPIVVLPGGPLLRNPSSRALLDALGLAGDHSDHDAAEVCDLLVVGGGPAGLAAAVYGASEGMTTTLAEDTALGGQAGTSSRIENYLGFPAGLSGDELTARAALQAQKFGVRVKLAEQAVALTPGSHAHEVTFDDGEVVTARSVIIATGARYNRLPLDRLAQFEGVGVYYAATQMEAQACAGGPVVVVGGGNSAGQAALFLARTCTQVHIVIRGDSLASSMSRYLIDQIERHEQIRISPRTEITAFVGDSVLDGVEIRDKGTMSSSTLATCGLFVFIGAKPSTGWLHGQLAEDDDGFILTGTDIPQALLDGTDHAPLVLETSTPGIFCVGDVRSRSVKRVAAAIGEGSMAVRLVFDRLEATGQAVADPPRAGALTELHPSRGNGPP
jgi:thioredoxin reductase (NADPH)